MHKIVDAAHERAVKMLTEKRKVLDNMARVLIERETIYTEEVDMLLEGATVSEVYEHMDKFEKAEAENPFKRFESVAEEVKAAESAAKTPEQASAPKEEPAQASEAASDGQAEKEDGSGKGPQETTDDTDDKGGKQQ